jgi:hypothetical protein
LTVQAAPGKYLHFCGIKVWALGGIQRPKAKYEFSDSDDQEDRDGAAVMGEQDGDCDREPEDIHIPEPERILTAAGTNLMPEQVVFKEESITMSSKWKDERMLPWNVVKTDKWNSNWGQGEFTCIHTLNDDDGAWWEAKFADAITVTKIQILNRNDCCQKRIEGVKVLVGETLFGTILEAPSGGWITLTNKAHGEFIKIQGPPKQYLHFCGLKVWAITTGEEVVSEEPEEPEPIKVLRTTGGGTVIPKLAEFKPDQITMSSKYNHEQNKPWNPIKSENFNANWGQGEFTCMHTLQDKAGPWWKAELFNKLETTTKNDTKDAKSTC